MSAANPIAVPSCLYEAAYVTGSDATVYTVPSNTTVIIDQFSFGNNDSSAHTLNVNIIPNGGSVGATNLVVNAQPIVAAGTAGSNGNLNMMQNQILLQGDAISVKADSASKLVIRISGRICS